MINYGKQSIDHVDIKSVINTLKSEYITQGPEIEKFENEEMQVSLSKPTKYRDGLYEVRVLPLIDTVETYEKSILH